MIPVLSAENITKDYGKEQILKGITLTLYKETFTAILGPSGCGKSTLIHILSGMAKPTGGLVRYENIIVTDLPPTQLADWKRSAIGNVFQNYLLLNNLTAEENIKVGICPGTTPLAFERLVRILELDGLLDKFPAQLSGGQQQRVAIARAVIKGARVLFCDEATGALDEGNSKKVVGLLHHLKAVFGVTVLFATHNKEIARTANRVLFMKDGMLVNDMVNENPISADDMLWEYCEK